MTDLQCKQCGKCCLEANGDTWLGSDLLWEEKQLLLKERKKYVPSKGCLMLYFEDKKSMCLIHVLFGKKKKDLGCQSYTCGD